MTTTPQEEAEEPFFRAYLSPSTVQLLRGLAARTGCDDPEELIEDLLLPGLQTAVREQDALCRCIANGLGHSPDALSPSERYPTAAALRPALIALITRAFDGVERGSGLMLHEADVQDFGGDWAEARRKDTDTRWQDVPDEAIEDCITALCIVDDAGFRYYLPAYMIWTLNYYRTPGSTLIDHAIYCLHPLDTSRFAAFTPAQAQATACFLRFMARSPDGQVDEAAAQKALEGYWGQFCPGDPV